MIPIPNEFASELQDYLERYRQRFDPEGLQEAALVESLALTAWRLARIPGLEESLFVRGQVEFADRFSSEDPQERNALIEAHTYLIYEKHFKLLSLRRSNCAAGTNRTKYGSTNCKLSAGQPAAVPGQRAKLFLVPRKKG